MTSLNGLMSPDIGKTIERDKNVPIYSACAFCSIILVAAVCTIICMYAELVDMDNQFREEMEEFKVRNCPFLSLNIHKFYSGTQTVLGTS